MAKKRILVAILNWGLGHATRSIPIIKKLQTENFEVLLASDGAALGLLRKEFPHLKSFELPSYNISYAKRSSFFSLKILLQTPHILKTISEENRVTRSLVKSQKLDGIISDNRWGVCSNLIPSVFISHQLNVLSGFTSLISSKIQQKYIMKFDECWVPDLEENNNLSGFLGHLQRSKFKIKYLGILSRFTKQELEKAFDILIILSGPEPQRSMLESKLIKEFYSSTGNVVLIRGIIEKEQRITKTGNLTVYNFMQSEELEDLLNRTELVIARSGYTTLLDLAKLGKKAFFIPTPGQAEQEYLAKRLKELKVADSCSQNNFSLKMLKNNNEYKGLIGFSSSSDLSNLFTLFQRE